MRIRKSKQLFNIVLEYENGMVRTVRIRAVTREIAEQRALKFNRGAKRVRPYG